MSKTPKPDAPEFRLYGRAQGKPLSARQQGLVDDLLPRIGLPESGPVNAAELLPRCRRQVLEIGFGGGEHLAARAAAHPRIGFIGAEAFVNGVVKLLADIEERGLRNVRIRDGDVAPLLARLPDACLGQISLLYPDPWPKRRQRKRRFVSDESLAQIARLLRDGGVFRFASDIDDYAGWTLARIARSPDLRWEAATSRDWLQPFAGWPGTRYEAKAIATGRRPTYLEFVRNTR